MAHNASGSGGTGGNDDSHFPSRGGFFRGESSSGAGRTPSMASEPNPVIGDDNVDATLHQLAIEAYKGVLTFFRANDNGLSWERQNLLTDLRAAKGLTSEEHGSILASASTDPTVQLIRLMRESRGEYATHDTSQLVHNRNPSTSGTGSPFRSFSPESTHTANQPSTSAGIVVGTDRNYPTSGEGSGQFGSHVPYAGRGEELVGWRVRTTRGSDNFYEGVITDYNPHEDQHTITYEESPTGSVRFTLNLQTQIRGVQIQWLRAPGHAMNDLPPPQHPRTQTFDIRSLVTEAERVIMDCNSTPQDRALAVNKLREQKQLLTNGISLLENFVGATEGDADQEMTGPDENQILVTDSVLTEAERVVNDSNSTAEEEANAPQQALD